MHRIKTIYQCLSQEYHKTLSTKEVWLSFSNDFKEKWNLPNCPGAMDKKTFVSSALIYLQVTIIDRKDFIVWFYLPFVIENIAFFDIALENLVVIMIVVPPKI